MKSKSLMTIFGLVFISVFLLFAASTDAEDNENPDIEKIKEDIKQITETQKQLLYNQQLILKEIRERDELRKQEDANYKCY